MSNPETPESMVQSTANSDSQTTTAPLSPLRCFLGAIVAGVIAYALYNMTSSIATTFAAKPIHTNSYIVQRISSAVRTLVVGMSTLGTGIFGFAAFGLLALGLQLTIQRSRGEAQPPGNSWRMSRALIVMNNENPQRADQSNATNKWNNDQKWCWEPLGGH